MIHGGPETILEFLLGGDPDVTQDRAGEFGKEAFDEVEPRAVPQHLRHLVRKVRVAALEAVAPLVRLHVFLVEDFAHDGLGHAFERK